MKRLLFLLLFLASPLLAQQSYRTYFPLTQNPISEGSRWSNGGTVGLDWGNMKTTPGFVVGVSQPAQFADPTAILTGTWDANQVAQGVVKVTSTPGSNHEIEVRLRNTVASNSITGYEVYCSVDPGNQYCRIARWGGPEGQYCNIDSGGTSISLQNGDILRGTVTGTSPPVITGTVWRNGSQLATWNATDTGAGFDGPDCGPGHAVYTTGKPGVGVFGNTGADADFAKFGFSEFFAYSTPGTFRIAANCNQAGVAAAITAAAAGDIILVPPGAACNWSGGISLSGKTLVGAGSGTTGTVVSGGAFTITKHATQLTEISGFRFGANETHGSVTGATNARSYILSNNYFFSSGAVFFNFLINGGVIHHNTFFSPSTHAAGPDALLVHPEEDWSQGTTFGTADVQGPSGGERNVYFENNTFTALLESSPDGDSGTRLVYRYNIVNDSSLVFHAGNSTINDTSTNGNRQFEVYNNTFNRTDAFNDNVNKWVWSRGGSGVVANNVMADPSSGEWGNKNSIILGVGCNLDSTPVGSWNGSWPIPHQIGQTNNTPATPTQPMLIFNNTGAGGIGFSRYIAIAGNDTGPGPLRYTTCSSPGTYVQNGRDYYLINQWGWTPFTYPHPLDTTFITLTPSAAAQPVFSPAAGNFTSPQTVSISNPSGAPVVCYTTNGTTPATNGISGCTAGSVYSSPVTINLITTLQAVAGGTGLLDSTVTSGVYNVLLPSPAFDHIAGAYTTSVNPLVISTRTPGATVCYRIGATPAATTPGTCDAGSTAGTVSADGNNQASLVVSSTSTVQALATQAGRSNSAIISSLFTIAAGCADPVITGLTAVSAANGQSETVTWTTDVPSDTMLMYGINNSGIATPVTDTAGVTSHSVTINNLLTATHYAYQARSRKIVGGIPCGNGYIVTTPSLNFFDTATATGANLTYGLSVNGPTYVTQGKKMYVKTTLNAKTGAFTSGAIKIVLSGLPANTTVGWADQQVFLISTSVVSTTSVSGDTLTINVSDCQSSGTNCYEEPFLITTASTPTGVANVTFTATATGTCVTNCVQTVSWPVTVVSSAAPFSGVAMPQVTPSSYPAIPAQATYLSDALTYGLQSCPQDITGTPASRTTFRRNDNTNMLGNPITPSVTYGSWFYDGTLANYNVSTMLETTASSGGNWAQCAENQKGWYTKSYGIPVVQAGLSFQLMTFSTGVYNDYKITGDPVSAAQLQANINRTFAPYHGVSVDPSFTQREVPYAMRNSIHGVATGLNCVPISGTTNCYNITTTVMRDFMMEHELGQVDQICLSQNAGYYSYFMTGFMAEDLIEYYDLVSKDIRIPPAIACLADYIYTYHWQETYGGTFPFDKTSEQTKINKPDTGSCSATLNDMIAPMYAWLYRYSSDPKWQAYGDEVFFSGTTFRNCAPDGAASILLYPSAGGGKNYSQNFHWPKYLEWRSAPAFQVFPGSVGFFNIPVSTQSGTRTVTLSNPTTSPVSITSSIAGTGYAITGTTCGASLAAATWLTPSTCTIQLKLTVGATQGATYAGTLTVNSIPVSLFGTGNSGTVAAPTITPAGGGVSYSAGQQFLIQSATVGATLCLSDANDDGIANAASFTTPMGSGASAGGTCTSGHAYPNPTTMTATTVGVGQYIRAVATKANMEDSVQALAQFTITAAATAPIASLAPPSLSFFTNRTVTSAPQTVTLTNTGTADLIISQVSISGLFAQSNNCPIGPPLAPAASCTFSVTFTPASTGSFNGTLTINDNAAGSPHTVALSGTGTAPVISLLPTTYSFGNIATSTTAISSAFTLQNTGNGPLAVHLSIGGAQPTFFGVFATNCPAILAAGSSCTLTVRFSPLTGISYAATLVETDPVATGSPTSNALTGTGVIPPASVVAPLPWIFL